MRKHSLNVSLKTGPNHDPNPDPLFRGLFSTIVTIPKWRDDLVYKRILSYKASEYSDRHKIQYKIIIVSTRRASYSMFNGLQQRCLDGTCVSIRTLPAGIP